MFLGQRNPILAAQRGWFESARNLTSRSRTSSPTWSEVLADTHAFLWFVTDAPHLSVKAKGLLEAQDTERFFSIAGVWEIAIKTSFGKLTLRRPLEEILPEQLAVNRFTLLNISAEHAFRVVRLPLHHRDPFDRMLAAQCLVENLPLVSNDDALDAYGIKRLW
jgi:PIN domain nuclease of toxin-antitoxin system